MAPPDHGMDIVDTDALFAALEREPSSTPFRTNEMRAEDERRRRVQEEREERFRRELEEREKRGYEPFRY